MSRVRLPPGLKPFCFFKQPISRYIPPLEGFQTVEKWLEEEKSQQKIHEELQKQQFLLDLLHSKISARHEQGKSTGNLDENAWQVQNSITAIKRKLKQLLDALPQVVPLNPISDTSRCIEMYEEKQLMATQGMLREDIAEERQKIAKLCWKLRNFKDFDEKIEKNEEKSEEWVEKCKLEEAARSTLLEEITRLRSECADLRARLEMESACL